LNAIALPLIRGGSTIDQDTTRRVNPSRFRSSSPQQRAKNDMLRRAKLKKFPNGLDVDGELRPLKGTTIGHSHLAAIEPMFHAELTKPLPERYIHGYLKTRDGGIIIVTFVPYLLKLLDDPGVTSFDGDTTFKGIEGKVNEWEMMLFAKVVQRGTFFRCWHEMI
jgi:hypothetical protein